MRLLVVLIGVLVAGTAAVAVGRADMGGQDGANLQAHFFGCTGPAGTPESFDATRQNIGTPWHVVGESETFYVNYAFDETTNTVLTPKAGNGPTPPWKFAVTCTFVAPLTGDTVLTEGFFGTG